MRRAHRWRLKAGTQGHLAAVVVVVALAAAETFAQEGRGRTIRTGATAAELPRRIIVSIPDRKLVLVEDGRVVKVYSVGVGASVTPSPSGQFRIIHRVAYPTYYHPGVVIPPGRSNPLGTRWLGLSHSGYGIHGTNEPSSIGHRSSHGCIRMRNHDMEELFELVRVGDVVELHAVRDAKLAPILADSKQHLQLARLPRGDETTLAAQEEAPVLPKEASSGRNN